MSSETSSVPSALATHHAPPARRHQHRASQIAVDRPGRRGRWEALRTTRPSVDRECEEAPGDAAGGPRGTQLGDDSEQHAQNRIRTAHCRPVDPWRAVAYERGWPSSVDTPRRPGGAAVGSDDANALDGSQNQNPDTYSVRHGSHPAPLPPMPTGTTSPPRAHQSLWPCPAPRCVTSFPARSRRLRTECIGSGSEGVPPAALGVG